MKVFKYSNHRYFNNSEKVLYFFKKCVFKLSIIEKSYYLRLFKKIRIVWRHKTEPKNLEERLHGIHYFKFFNWFWYISWQQD